MYIIRTNWISTNSHLLYYYCISILLDIYYVIVIILFLYWCYCISILCVYLVSTTRTQLHIPESDIHTYDIQMNIQVHYIHMIYKWIYKYMYTWEYMYLYTYTNTYIYKYTYTYIYAYRCCAFRCRRTCLGAPSTAPASPSTRAPRCSRRSIWISWACPSTRRRVSTRRRWSRQASSQKYAYIRPLLP